VEHPVRPPLLYPDRKRCRTCRNYFDFTVILRLYCSYECAGLPERPSDPADLPRQYRVLRDGVWTHKSVFRTPEDAEMEAVMQGIYSYACEPPVGCGMWHLSKHREPACGWNPAEAAPACDFDPYCRVHGEEARI
jgi:hypothetical protein